MGAMLLLGKLGEDKAAFLSVCEQFSLMQMSLTRDGFEPELFALIYKSGYILTVTALEMLL